LFLGTRRVAEQVGDIGRRHLASGAFLVHVECGKMRRHGTELPNMGKKAQLLENRTAFFCY